jgi:hypothetical protein
MARQPAAPHGREEIRLFVSALEDALAVLRGVQDRMDVHDIKRVSVLYGPEMRRGIRGVANFSHSARQAVFDLLSGGSDGAKEYSKRARATARRPQGQRK